MQEAASSHAAAERRPARAVPCRDRAGRHATRGGEVAARDEDGPAAIVERREDVDLRERATARSASQGLPARAIPLGDVDRRDTAGGEEIAADVERGTATVVEGEQR